MFTRGSSYYIGRVGALAVALGVGVLVTTGQGVSVARAQTGTDSSTASSTEGSPDAGAGGATGTATAPPAAAAPPPPGPSTAPAPPAGVDSPATAGGSTAPEMLIDSSGGVDTSTNDAGQSTDDAEEIPAASPEPELDAVPAAGTEPVAESVGTEGSVAQHDSSAGDLTLIDTASTAQSLGESAQDPEADLMDTAEAPDSADVSLIPLTLRSVADDAATDADQGFAAFTTQASTVSEVEAVPTVARGPIATLGAVIVTGVVNVATAVVNLLLSPFLAAGPLDPTPQPLTLVELLGSIVTATRYRLFNDAPVVGDRDITLVLGPAEVSVPIAFNASDADGDPLKYEVLENRRIDGPQHGTVTIDQATGTFTYDPDEGYTGPDEFTVEVSDDTGALHFHGLSSLLLRRAHTDTATISLNVVAPVNDAPTAVDDDALAAEDTTTAVVIDVLANDSDPDNDAVLTITTVTQGANGATVTTDGATVSYTPAANFDGTDTFTYTITDGAGGTATATVTVTVTPSPINDDPTAVDDDATAAEDTATAVVIDVLANDTDPDNDAVLTITTVTQRRQRRHRDHRRRRHRVTYTPAANFAGTDTFTYTITDAGGLTATATVTVTVTPARSTTPRPRSTTTPLAAEDTTDRRRHRRAGQRHRPRHRRRPDQDPGHPAAPTAPP